MSLLRIGHYVRCTKSGCSEAGMCGWCRIGESVLARKLCGVLCNTEHCTTDSAVIQLCLVPASMFECGSLKVHSWLCILAVLSVMYRCAGARLDVQVSTEKTENTELSGASRRWLVIWGAGS